MAIYYNAVKITSETFCKNWKRQCANGELLQVRKRSVGDMTTICVHTVNSIIRIKNSARL